MIWNDLRIIKNVRIVYPSSASGINRIMNESILIDCWMIMNMLILVDDYLMNGMKNDVLMIDDN